MSKHKKIVVVNGCFDVIHSGHLKLLREASALKLGGKLIVGINSDKSVRKLKGPSRPVNKQEDRKDMLQAIRYVDGVFIFDKCADFLESVRPDIYVKASDYSMDTIDKEEKKILLKIGSEIKFIDFKKGLSTTSILRKLGHE